MLLWGRNTWATAWSLRAMTLKCSWKWCSEYTFLLFSRLISVFSCASFEPKLPLEQIVSEIYLTKRVIWFTPTSLSGHRHSVPWCGASAASVRICFLKLLVSLQFTSRKLNCMTSHTKQLGSKGWEMIIFADYPQWRTSDLLYPLPFAGATVVETDVQRMCTMDFQRAVVGISSGWVRVRMCVCVWVGSGVRDNRKSSHSSGITAGNGWPPAQRKTKAKEQIGDFIMPIYSFTSLQFLLYFYAKKH